MCIFKIGSYLQGDSDHERVPFSVDGFPRIKTVKLHEVLTFVLMTEFFEEGCGSLPFGKFYDLVR